MKKANSKIALALLCAIMSVLARTAHATVSIMPLPANAEAVIFNMNKVSSGYGSEGLVPWFTLKIEKTGVDRVSFLFDASGLVGTEAIGKAYVNMDESLIPGLSVTQISGPAATVAFAPNAFNAGPDHGFDGLFDFPQPVADRFTSGQTALFELYAPGLTLDSFLMQIHGKDHFAEFHLFSGGLDGSKSGWIAACDYDVVVPEWSTIVFGTVFVGGLGLCEMKRRKKGVF